MGEQPEYGFDIDNFIGTTEQRNNWHRKWAQFFADHRIGLQLKLAEEKGMFFGDIETIVEAVKERLSNHQQSQSAAWRLMVRQRLLHHERSHSL